jgi:[protein-PII] uridylyltransferase
VLDIFYVEQPYAPILSNQKHMNSIYKKWAMLSRNEITADSLVSERLNRYPLKKLRPSPVQDAVQVNTNNEASQFTTMLSIKTADNFGLLHKIIQVLNKNTVNIHSAHLSTRIDQAVDVFYVTDAAGKKITDTAILSRLSSEIKEALKE